MARSTALPPTEPISAWYVVDIEDNRKDPDPFRVQLRPLTAADLRREREVVGIGRLTKAGAANVDAQVAALTARLFAEYVGSVQGYSGVTPEGERTTPSTGAELYALLERGSDRERTLIVDDILEALRDYSKLDEGVLGNSVSRSALP